MNFKYGIYKMNLEDGDQWDETLIFKIIHSMKFFKYGVIRSVILDLWDEFQVLGLCNEFQIGVIRSVIMDLWDGFQVLGL